MYEVTELEFQDDYRVVKFKERWIGSGLGGERWRQIPTMELYDRLDYGDYILRWEDKFKYIFERTWKYSKDKDFGEKFITELKCVMKEPEVYLYSVYYPKMREWLKMDSRNNGSVEIVPYRAEASLFSKYQIYFVEKWLKGNKHEYEIKKLKK